MAANLNVLPIAGIPNVHTQKLLQDLRNLQVGRQGFRLSVFNIINCVEGPGGGVADLAALYGISSAQAQVLYDEASAFSGVIEGDAAAWDKINRICGISV